MYNTFSDDYDRFVNWKNRLAFEMPFIEKTVSQARRETANPAVLDAACGTGMHAIALAKLGFSVSGADLFPEMIARAKENAAREGVNVHFEPAGFGSLEKTFGSGKMDALLCLGNSLPHVLSPSSLDAVLRDFAACLSPGGRLIIQNRNFDAILTSRQRWMPPESARTGDEEWLFLRFYDFEPDGLITFNILELHRTGSLAWSQQLHQTCISPQRHADLVSALAGNGFPKISAYGSLAGEPFDPLTSPNLVLAAERG